MPEAISSIGLLQLYQCCHGELQRKRHKRRYSMRSLSRLLPYIRALIRKRRSTGCIRHERQARLCCQLVRGQGRQLWRWDTQPQGRCLKHTSLPPVQKRARPIKPSIHARSALSLQDGSHFFAQCHRATGRVMRAANIQNSQPTSTAYTIRRLCVQSCS